MLCEGFEVIRNIRNTANFLTCPSKRRSLSWTRTPTPRWRRSVSGQMNVQEILPFYPVQPWQQTVNTTENHYQRNCSDIITMWTLPICVTFQWVDSRDAQGTAPSLVHLEMEFLVHPQASGCQLPDPPQSAGAPTSNWPVLQWSGSPGHLLHLQEKAKEEPWNKELLDFR